MKRFFFGIFISTSLLVSSCNGNEATGNATPDSTAEATTESTANPTDSVTVDSDSTSK
jgi:hypothetical protein